MAPKGSRAPFEKPWDRRLKDKKHAHHMKEKNESGLLVRGGKNISERRGAIRENERQPVIAPLAAR